MTATAATAAHHLQYVIDSWDHLHEMLTTRHGSIWPPAGRMADQLAAAADADAYAEELAARALERIAERADSRYTLGESPAPIRLQIVDTMRAVETDLVYLCDVLAQEVQRPPMRRAPSHWLPADREMRDKLAEQDATDPRRWRYREMRTASFAAVWLLTRVEERPGPFLRLTTEQARRVAGVAAACAGRVDRALDAVRQAEVVTRPCPLCGGVLGLSSGDGGLPIVACFGCRQEWTMPLAEVA